MVLGTNNIDHHRTADFPAFAAALSGKPEMTASMRYVYNAPAFLLIGNDPTEQHPLLAWQSRNNVRLHRARLYVVNSQSIKLRRQAASFLEIPARNEASFAAFLAGDDSAANTMGTGEQWLRLREKLRGEQNLVIIFGSELRGDAIAELVKFAYSIPGAKLVCLGDYANSRGAADMYLYPDLLPGYHTVAEKGKLHTEWGGIPEAPGLSLPEMVASGKTVNPKA